MFSIEPKITARPRRLWTIAGTLLATIVGITGVQAASPADSTQTHQSANAPKHHWYEIGRASWYGRFFQGRTTASGEVYDMNELTCAHRTLPLGSLVRVTNLRNHKSVVVRVNDRGPLPENRVIDLSYAAARFLGFSQRGTAPVRVELIRANPEVAQLSWPLTPAAAR
ncbi:septal ring lytic transglycosylase RlpA family protein [Paracidobacterium acidisoli]|uniref:Probable endolytic peptidoglycan transglycosylase RlpA n=1 Tax=Paracidobacterium acidisoli TaxID=2303751 RepID=A0A372IS67_9BACT|nr:septal ring lytic transglycosylase RlpA family protein [Paracidobacterium acidisoli]MBT9330662.1 septal ring lytic transglycosylase RlpA family protein [Paracidobacterium acidisoli]